MSSNRSAREASAYVDRQRQTRGFPEVLLFWAQDLSKSGGCAQGTVTCWYILSSRFTSLVFTAVINDKL